MQMLDKPCPPLLQGYSSKYIDGDARVAQKRQSLSKVHWPQRENPVGCF